MPKRYVTQSRWSDQLKGEAIDIGIAHTVHEPDETPRFTGLLDADGYRIMRLGGLEPVGFIRWKGSSDG